MTDTVKILLVDDHQMLRDGLRSLLESQGQLEVVGEASSGGEAIQLTGILEPDVVVLDLGLPDMNGLEVLPKIKEIRSETKVIVLSMHISREYVSRAVEIGCDGYIPKSSTHTSLLEAIQIVMEGERFLHPRAASVLMASIAGGSKNEEQKLDVLSERELEVVRLTALGFTSRESGLKLHISPKTVDTYRTRAMEKLGIEQRSELIRFALKSGLLDDVMNEDSPPDITPL
jgi:two-component system response regulator NreC